MEREDWRESEDRKGRDRQEQGQEGEREREQERGFRSRTARKTQKWSKIEGSAPERERKHTGGKEMIAEGQEGTEKREKEKRGKEKRGKETGEARQVGARTGGREGTGAGKGISLQNGEENAKRE